MNKRLPLLVILSPIILFLAACSSPTPTPAPPPTARPSPTPLPTETPTPSPAGIWQIRFADAYRSPHPDGETLTLELVLLNRQDTNKRLRATDLRLHNAAHLDDFPLMDTAQTWNVSAGGTEKVKWQFLVPPGAAGQTAITAQGVEIVNVGEWYDVPEFIPPPTPTPTPADTWRFELVEVHRSPHPDGEILTVELNAQNRQARRGTLRARDLTLLNAAHIATFPALNAGESWRVPAHEAQKMTWQFVVLNGAVGETNVVVENWGTLYVGKWEDFPPFIPMQLELRGTRLHTTIKIAYRGVEIELPNTIVDTGMDTIIDRDVAARIGIVQNPADVVYTWRVLGGDITFFRREVDFVQLGAQRVEPFEIAIGDLGFNQVNCLLGSDFFIATGGTLNFSEPSIEFTETKTPE